MKTTFRIHIPANSKNVVKIGDPIGVNGLLANTTSEENINEIELAKILGVNPGKIAKYMRKKIGDNVNADEVIALRKRLFSSVVVKSPARGEISSIDLRTGIIAYKSERAKERKITAPVAGKIKSITEKDIEIECEAIEFPALSGSGKRVSGILRHIKGEQVGVLDVSEDIARTIILVNTITSAAVAKLDAMDAKGVITLKILDDIILPFLVIDKSLLPRLEEKIGKETIIDPDNKKVYILH